MIHQIKYLTDFIFRFNKEQKETLDKIEGNPKTRPDFHTWTIITILLPLLTFVVAVIFNFILAPAPNLCFFYINWPKYLLNGSIPIISFGIISSGVSYLMEDIDRPIPIVQSIRRRVMSIALMFLFLTSVLYIFQSVSFVNEGLKELSNLLLLIFSIVVCLFSVSIGLKMYLLQKSMLPDFEQNIKDHVGNLNKELENTFGNGE